MNTTTSVQIIPFTAELKVYQNLNVEWLQNFRIEDRGANTLSNPKGEIVLREFIFYAQ
jgi:hypothetical protein